MIRLLHRWPGLLAMAILTVLTISGAALSVFPAAERLSAPQASAAMTVADLAARVQSVHPGVEQIRRAPSGRITVYWFDQGVPGAAVIDPATGQAVASADPGSVRRWLTNLHRSLFLGDGGRIAMAMGALAMLVLSVSGAVLVARRAGGWRHWFAPLRGPLSGRLHVQMARVSVPALVFSSVTALWMTASTFGLLPDQGVTPPFPTDVSGHMGVAVSMIDALVQTPVDALRELSFPLATDPSDVFSLTTDTGTALLDQGSGATLAWAAMTSWQSVSETIYRLHTGQGAALLGLVLGIMALGVPMMGVTGILIWLAGSRGRPRIVANRPAGRADTIVLVGSEGGSTWSFAATLHKALTATGHQVHVAPMSTFAPDHYALARRIIVLAATYGDGDAPASAKGFLARLAALKTAPDVPLAVLGFGDRGFPGYCAFSRDVVTAAEAKSWRQLMPADTVDRQSAQDFARWGAALGIALNVPLELSHQPILPTTQTLTLISRRDFGARVQAPTAILRFALPPATAWQRLTRRGFGRFAAGDLLGILPDGSGVPRLYSLASGRRDGFVEIVVRRQPGGLCSGQLTALQPGDHVTAFLRRNPAFQPQPGRAPLILIGAGTGVGPLAGFVRANRARRPMHLFFGMRDPASDYLYQDELGQWLACDRLSRLVTAVSRGAHPGYVQDALRDDAAQISALIRDGARVMVCGGREMASGVATVLQQILAPVGITPTSLKAEGRYVEDVY